MSNNEVSSRLEFMGIDDRQRATLARIQPIVRSLLGRALDRFYDKVRANPVTAKFFRDNGHITAAKGAQETHWQRIASGQFDENFYNSVRRIGAVHARIGLDTRYYVGGYAHVLDHLIHGVQSGCSIWRRALTGFSRPSAAAATTAIVKAALLDMELSMSVYFEEAQLERDRAIAGLEQALNLLADGDLSSDLSEMPASFRTIEEAYNRTLDKMRGMIGSVSDSATSIRTGSGEIAQASEDLARRTEANAASLEETSAAVVQMDERLRATAAAATSTLARADGAIGVVGSGRTLALEAVEAMGRVSESAKGIDSVIEGLDKIAFQTRVLAMNAAVEAGRAGDAGRGFAVVADLVSALAMRSEEEAKSARDQLTVTQSDIITAVDAVKKVDGAFENISSDVGEVHAQLGQIAADNQAQSSTITQISAAVSSMDHATQQNAAMVEETSAASRNLLGEATSLTEHAHHFRLAATDRPKPKPTAAPPRHFVPERKSPTKQSQTKTYVSPVKPLASSAGSSAKDDWQDF